MECMYEVSTGFGDSNPLHYIGHRERELGFWACPWACLSVASLDSFDVSQALSSDRTVNK